MKCTLVRTCADLEQVGDSWVHLDTFRYKRSVRKMNDDQRTWLMLIFVTVLISAALPFIALLE